LAIAAPAQDPLPPASSLTDFVTPIHSSARHDGSDAGLWAAGRDYKVSFHDGMVFYPYVGPSRAHQPVRWRTTSVRIDGVEQLPAGAPAAPQWSDLRCDYALGPVIERYDVRLEGVEQSFVFTRRVTGDLVIRGELSTELAVPRADGHGALRLALADGTPAVEYGAAIAIDAAGRSVPVRTSSDGAAITLRVDRDFVATAEFPLVIDPLVRSVLVQSGDPIGSIDVLHEALSTQGQQARAWIVYDRRVAANDDDLWIVRVGNSFSGTPIVVFSANSTWSDRNGSIALAPDASIEGRTVTAFVTEAPALPAWISIHCHDVNDLNLRTSAGAFSLGFDTYSRPDVGGRIDGGQEVLIVCQVDDISSGMNVNTDTSAVHGILWDADFGTSGQPASAEFVLRNRPNRDQERPCVNQAANNAVWLVTFQELDGTIANDDWDVELYEVNGAATVTDTALDVEEAADVTLHKLGPQVSGAGGRYLLAYTTQAFEQLAPKPQNTLGELLRVQRVDWDASANTGDLPHAAVTLHERSTAIAKLGGLAHDDISDDHWVVTTLLTDRQLLEAWKLGFSGAVVESGVVSSDRALAITTGGVTFNDEQRQYLIAFGADDGVAKGADLLGARMLYDTVAAPSTYGFACGAGVMAGLTEMVDEQQIGSESLTLQLVNAQFDGTGYLLLAFGRAAIPLLSVGAPGCDWLVDPATYLGAIPTVVAGGNARVVIPLPESLPPFTLDCQWLYEVPPQVNALQLLASEGVEIPVGR
jgi:hypothetical protein